MSSQAWRAPLVTAQGQGGSLSNSTTATSIIPPGSKTTIPAGLLLPGTMLKVTATGRLSNIVTTPGTLTLDVRLGSVVAFNAGAMQLSTTAHTTLPFWFEALLTCRAIGQSTNANLIGLGRMISQCVVVSGADGTAGHGDLLAPNSTPTVGTGFDSTAAQTVDLFATFSIANAGNLIQLEQFLVELIN